MLNDENYLQKLFIDQVTPALENANKHVDMTIQTSSLSKEDFLDTLRLDYINIDGATSVATSGFEGSCYLVNLNLPHVTKIYDKAFKDCDNLNLFSIPLTTDIGLRIRDLKEYMDHEFNRLVITPFQIVLI